MKTHREWYREKKHFLGVRFRNCKQRHRSIMLEDYPYTLEQFRERFIEDETFNRLFGEWENSNYERAKSVSFDRIDESLGYTFDNIELKTLEENQRRHGELTRRGVGSSAHRNKPVTQREKDGTFVRTYISQAEASRATGIPQSAISACVSGKYNSGGGFVWS